MKISKPKESLKEGLGGYITHWYTATAKHYQDVDNFDGPLEGVGPDLGNDKRLIERHLERLSSGRPIDSVIKDLLERTHPR